MMYTPWLKKGLTTLALVGATVAQAQSYPQQSVRLVVPFAPGGGSDIMARTLSEPFAKQLGQPVVIDNKPGAGAVIGADIVAKSKPDGYTVLYTTIGPQITNPFLMKQLPYDAMADLAPVAMIGQLINVLAIHPSVPARNTKDFIQYAKANPGKINFSSSGIGTSSHLGGELFKSMAGLDISHIAYKGTGPALQDLMSGQVQMTIDSLVTLLPFIKSGKLIALGVSSHERSPILPDVPPISDSLPGFESSTVNSMTVRTGTPRSIIDRLNRDMATVLRSAEVHDRFVSMGILPVVETPEQLAGRIKRESEKWKRVIEVSGAKID
jgi:tripartite-type tricarboxylate transporter receptor subunit TctC